MWQKIKGLFTVFLPFFLMYLSRNGGYKIKMMVELKVNFKSRTMFRICGAEEREGVLVLYTIGEMAKRLGVAPSTLRYYDKEGLLPFVERSEGGTRMFKDSDFEWLSIIECLKKTGMSIKEIGQFIAWCIEGDATIDLRLELIKRQQMIVSEQMQQLQDTLDMLDYKRWYYETAQEAGSCAAPQEMTDDKIPQRFREQRNRSRGL